MNQPDALDQLAATLQELRQNPITRRRYPKTFWESVSQLAKSRPLNEICQRLGLHSDYVKNKIGQSQLAHFDFREVSFSHDLASTVTIELSNGDVKARIQGPVSVIDHLCVLFRK